MIPPMTNLPKAYVATMLSGVLLGLGFPAWHWWLVVWLALVPVFRRAIGTKPGTAARHFFLGGFTFHAIVLQWLLSNVYWAGGWAVWGYVLLCVYMALYWALLGGLLAWLTPRLPRMLAPLAFGVLWAAMEFMTRKDYVDNWVSECHETFCHWSWRRWQAELAAAGFEVDGPGSWRNDWLVEHRFYTCAELRDPDTGARIDWPATHVLFAARRTQL